MLRLSDVPSRCENGIAEMDVRVAVLAGISLTSIHEPVSVGQANEQAGDA
jgi:hypothetical protein